MTPFAHSIKTHARDTTSLQPTSFKTDFQRPLTATYGRNAVRRRRLRLCALTLVDAQPSAALLFQFENAQRRVDAILTLVGNETRQLRSIIVEPSNRLNVPIFGPSAKNLLLDVDSAVSYSQSVRVRMRQNRAASDVPSLRKQSWLVRQTSPFRSAPGAVVVCAVVFL